MGKIKVFKKIEDEGDGESVGCKVGVERRNGKGRKEKGEIEKEWKKEWKDSKDSVEEIKVKYWKGGVGKDNNEEKEGEGWKWKKGEGVKRSEENVDVGINKKKSECKNILKG